MSTDAQELPEAAGNSLPSSKNPVLERLLGHVPELSARDRGGSPMYRWLLACVMLLGVLVFVVGIDWGLPSRDIDRYLFGAGEPWTGETISRLADAQARVPTSQAANIDVDARPLAEQPGWTSRAETEADRADILLRYRLYSYQPDEMTVFQAIESMDPESGDFDPKMYQYGAPFLYPIAALLKACAVIGWLDLRSDVGFYLDNPDEFAGFYLVARGYVVLFGLLGILAAYKLGSALRDRTAGLVAALLFVLMPVVVNMAHEAKPHLPAAVLAMWATYSAIRYLQKPGGGRLLAMSVLCGLAAGMLPAAAYVLVLIPVAAFAGPRTQRWIIGSRAWNCWSGLVLAGVVYLLCNPYVAINLVVNPELVRSNFVNTSGMYAFGNLLEGARNALRLTLEGTGPLLALAALLPLLSLGDEERRLRLLLLGAPALLVLALMIALGANQPGEFGRFGVYLDVVLMLAVAAEIGWILRRSAWAGGLAVLILAMSTGFYGLRYLQQFRADATRANTRTQAAAYLAGLLADDPASTVGVVAEPAPYAVPPMNFARWDVHFLSRPRHIPGHEALREMTQGPEWVVSCADRPEPEGARVGVYELRKVFRAAPDWIGPYDTIISWANKPLCVWQKVPADR